MENSILNLCQRVAVVETKVNIMMIANSSLLFIIAGNFIKCMFVKMMNGRKNNK